MDSHKCLRCRWQTRMIRSSNNFFYSAYSCYIHLSTMGVNNIAADHEMFRTLTGNLSWQRLRRSPVDLYSKSKKSLEPPYRALRGNVRTPSMARWKAHGRLYIHHNWTFFTISYGWDVMSGNRSKSAFFEGGGSLWAQISEESGCRPPTTLGIRVAEWLPFRVVSKYLQCVI